MSSPTFTFRPAQLPQYELRVSVGEAQGLDGQTEVVVSGDGAFIARQSPGLGALSKEGMQTRAALAHEQVEFIMRSALQFEWNDKFPPRPGIPDEAIVLWTLAGPELPGLTLRMWLRDAEKHRLAGEVLSVLRQALAKASDGRLFL